MRDADNLSAVYKSNMDSTTSVSLIEVENCPCIDGTCRDDQFWFDDGTIDLIAGQTHFRVYKGPLAKHSPVFRDMLSLPQPSSNDAHPTPSTLVNLAESPEDVRHFLKTFVAGSALR